MKPGHLPDDETQQVDDDLEAAEPGSTVRARRRRFDPRLEAIAEAARSGELSEQEAIEQIIEVMDATLGQTMPDVERLATKAAMRLLAPEVLAAARDDE